MLPLQSVFNNKGIHKKKKPPHRSRGGEADYTQHLSKEEEEEIQKRGLQLLSGDVALSLSMNTFEGIHIISKYI